MDRGGERYTVATLVGTLWSQTNSRYWWREKHSVITQHQHVHVLVAAGALSASGEWMRSRRRFLFPVRALSKLFRGKFLDALGRSLEAGDLVLAAGTAALAGERARRNLFAALRRHDWVVYAKRPFAGPEAVLAYLGRYTHRTAIGNERLLSLSADTVRNRRHRAPERASLFNARRRRSSQVRTLTLDRPSAIVPSVRIHTRDQRLDIHDHLSGPRTTSHGAFNSQTSRRDH